MKAQKLLNLESLRGIAAISVAFHHFDNGSYFNNIFTENADLMVDFFFVLSGFVISLNYSERLSSFDQLYVFQRKRFLRLYPLHLLMLIVFLGIEIAKYIAELKFNIIANNGAFSENNLTAFIANIFLIQNWIIPNSTFNFPSWSISAEFFTYAIFGFLVLATTKSKAVFYTTSAIMIVIAGLALSKYGMESDNVSGPLRCIFSFFIGVITQVIFSKLDKRIQLDSSLPGVLLIVLSVLAVIILGDQKFGLIVLVPFVFSATILVLVLSSNETAVNRALNLRVLVYLGTISYGIYMIHAAVWWIFRQSMRFVFSFPEEVDPKGIIKVVVENTLLANAISISGILIVILLAHLSYRFFETRFSRM